MGMVFGVRNTKPVLARRFFLCFFLGTTGLVSTSAAWALRPIYHTIALVAGEGTASFRDGDFTSAQFNKPLGMAISSDGHQLFVADSANNRIRVVHLDQNNQVTTLTGQDSPGKQNGPLASARFNQPRAVVYLPGDQLVVNDSGNKLLRLIDLKSGMVSDLGGSSPTTLEEGPASLVSMAGIWAMAYLPAADALFFTQPDIFTLKQIDVKTGKVTLVLKNKQGMDRPMALCSDGDKLFLAGRDQPQVYQLNWKAGVFSEPVSVATSAGNVTGLAKTGDYLYALQGGVEAPLERLLPRTEPVTFTSAFGDKIPNPGENLPSFMNMHWEDPVCFVADPLNERKLYISNPFLNMVTSYRDLLSGNEASGEGGRTASGVNDFDYPAAKPAGTFRILLVGDSRSVMVVNYPFTPTWNSQHAFPAPRQLSISKRMELELNTFAALDDKANNFEVLNLDYSAAVPLFLWPTYEVPEVVQKNDIDLVVIMQPPTIYSVYPFIFYFERPITAEGIPTHVMDPEYLLKPPSQRIPKGPAGKFYDLCKSLHLVHIEGNNFVFDQHLFLKPQLHDLLVELYGKPLEILSQKLSTMKTSSGQPVRLLVCSTHSGYWRSGSGLEDPKMWKYVTDKLHVPFLDVNPEMTALNISYYPLDENGSTEHFDPDGHLFFSVILAHALIRDGYIPWNQAPTPVP